MQMCENLESSWDFFIVWCNWVNVSIMEPKLIAIYYIGLYGSSLLLFSSLNLKLLGSFNLI